MSEPDPNHPECVDCDGYPLSGNERCGRSTHRPHVVTEPPLTPEEARVIIDAGHDPERILAYLFGEADD